MERVTKITSERSEVHPNAIVLHGIIIDIAEGESLKVGHEVTDDTNGTATQHLYGTANAPLAFCSTIDGLLQSGTFFYRSKAINEQGEIYLGKWLEFNTDGIDQQIAVTTDTAFQYSPTGIQVKGSMHGLGALSCNEFGHVLSLSPYPTVADSKISYGQSNQDSAFYSEFNELVPGFTYHLRSYIVLPDGEIRYGENLAVIMNRLIVSTVSNSISAGSTILVGRIEQIGVTPVTDHGQCWSTTTSYPTINDEIISLGATTTTGIFNCTLPGLEPGKTYFFRAYAKTGNQYVYGQIMHFNY